MLAALTLLPLAVFSLASPMVKRDDVAIDQAISYIQGNISATNDAVNNFNKDKDAIGALTIQTKANKLIDSVDNAAAVANMSEPLNDDQSFNVATAVINLQPKINGLLDNLEKHKPQFDTAIFGHSASPLVVMTLKKAKTSADGFAQAVTAKLSPTYASAAPAVKKQIDDKFDEAIKYFQMPPASS